ncbi:MAG: DnaB-like helicase C-terminal domain-containing protein [Lachnospiraceae bacterium]|nr:DnaB-like helicase C-terminal domain-containing protein [Lachnospiraceae bacterium]
MKSRLNIKGTLAEIVRKIELRSNPKAEYHDRRVSTGFYGIDSLIKWGFKNGDLVLLAGRPSMGKTALALSIIRNSNLIGKKAVFFTENASLMTTRLLSMESGIEPYKLSTGRLSAEELQRVKEASNQLRSFPLLIDDEHSASLDKIKETCKRLKQEHIDLIVVDNLQSVFLGKNTLFPRRKADYGYIVKTLKGLAKKLGCSMVVLTTLPRSVERRTDKRPLLSDLDAFGIDLQQVDKVLMLYRDEFYERDTDERDTARVFVEKDGTSRKIGSALLNTDLRMSRFYDTSPAYSGMYQYLFEDQDALKARFDWLP